MAKTHLMVIVRKHRRLVVRQFRCVLGVMSYMNKTVLNTLELKSINTFAGDHT